MSQDSTHAAAPAARPRKHRLAGIMVLAVYPVITALLYVVLPLTENWQTWQRTLVITPVMVLTIVFLISPAIYRVFWHFLHGLPKITSASQRIA